MVLKFDAVHGDDLLGEGEADVLSFDGNGVDVADLYASVSFLGACRKRGSVSASAGPSRVWARPKVE
ncbi:MAG: hypothetical protein O3C21_13805 [Verrucomicrobia bacterium]|nr:hypothetical protein [Verrucomicrobiota bacterium]